MVNGRKRCNQTRGKGERKWSKSRRRRKIRNRRSVHVGVLYEWRRENKIVVCGFPLFLRVILWTNIAVWYKHSEKNNNLIVYFDDNKKIEFIGIKLYFINLIKPITILFQVFVLLPFIFFRKNQGAKKTTHKNLTFHWKACKIIQKTLHNDFILIFFIK